MKFRPLHDRVVVKRIDAEEKTAGGIIIPDTAKEKPSHARPARRRGKLGAAATGLLPDEAMRARMIRKWSAIMGPSAANNR